MTPTINEVEEFFEKNLPFFREFGFVLESIELDRLVVHATNSYILPDSSEG